MAEENIVLTALSKQFIEDGVIITVGVNSKNEVVNDICLYGRCSIDHGGDPEDPFCSREVTTATLSSLSSNFQAAFTYSNELLKFINCNL